MPSPAVDDLQVGAFVQPLLGYLTAQFPRACTTCARPFPDFAAWVSTTSPLGMPVCFDQGDAEAAGEDPVGTLSMVDCVCGTTLAISCHHPDSEMYQQLVAALRGDAVRHAISVDDVLQVLREEIRRRSQLEPAAESAP